MTPKPRRITLSILDLSSLTFAFLISLFIRQSDLSTKYFSPINYSVNSYLISFITAAIILLFIFAGFKLYQIRQIELSAGIFTVLKALTTWTVVIATLIYFIKFDFSRGMFIMTVIGTTILICLGRYFYFKHCQKKMSDVHIETIILGTGERANDIENQIKNSLPNSICKKLDITIPSNHHFLKSYSPTEIFIADESLSRDKVLSLIADENLGHHSFRVILDVFRLATGEIRLNEIDEVPSITPRNEPRTTYKLIKRFTDILISLAGIILISPLWLLIMVIIKLDSMGPAHIYQTRIGWNGKPFTIIKFRTMHSNVSLYGLAPRNNSDDRITKAGRFLRRLSLDELPQLLNILRGDMSLVGPRPEMPFIVESYVPWQRFRLKAKPGLAGLWQILGRKDLPLHENLEYDFYYVANRSLLLDSAIILKTVPAVLFGRGAY